MDIASLESAGWKQLETKAFTASCGPWWVHHVDGVAEVGFIAETRHANDHIGTVHGGVLMTFADVALGYAVGTALSGPYCVTVQLQLQFVATAPIGSLVTCRPELVRLGSQLAFVRGLIVSGDKTVAIADGIWKVLERR